MFITADHVLDLPSRDARIRLAGLLGGDSLTRASQAAYQDGFGSARQAGSLGDVPGPARLVRVRFLAPVDRGEVTTVGFRWEAAGPAAGPYPVLDANLTLAPDAGHRTRLAIAGSYRPPPGGPGTGLDQAAAHRLAAATIRSLLAGIAGTLTSD